MDGGGAGQWWADEDPRRGGPTNLQLQLRRLSPQVAGFIYTGRQWGEDDSVLWLVGADTLYIHCLARGVHRQLLQDTVGPAVGRRDLAG